MLPCKVAFRICSMKSLSLYKYWLHPCIKGKPTQYLSPGQTGGTNMLPHLFFSIKNLIWPQDPLIERKIDFSLHFWAPWSFYYKNTSKNVQNPSLTIWKFEEIEISLWVDSRKYPFLRYRAHLLDFFLSFCLYHIIFCNLGSRTNIKFFRFF